MTPHPAKKSQFPVSIPICSRNSEGSITVIDQQWTHRHSKALEAWAFKSKWNWCKVITKWKWKWKWKWAKWGSVMIKAWAITSWELIDEDSLLSVLERIHPIYPVQPYHSYWDCCLTITTNHILAVAVLAALTWSAVDSVHNPLWCNSHLLSFLPIVVTPADII